MWDKGRANQSMVIGGPQNGGNHWVLVDAELRLFMKIIHCDTLAWHLLQIPLAMSMILYGTLHKLEGTKSHLVSTLPVQLIGRVLNVMPQLLPAELH